MVTKWIYRYPIPIEITYDQVSECISHGLKRTLLKAEYGINAKLTTLENSISNAELEQIQQVIENIVRTCNITQSYVDEDEPWLGTLATAAFAIHSTTSSMKFYSPGQFIFDCETFKNSWLGIIMSVKAKAN